jgi:hypothetical protein
LWHALTAAPSGVQSSLLSPTLPRTLQFPEGQHATEEADQMTRNEVFPGKYLKADDLKGKACVATIESAPYVTLKGLDGNETKKIVLHFKNAQKTLPLNATNFDAVCDATGCPDTDD